MALTKKVNGVEVALDAAEEAALQAEWEDNQRRAQQVETARQAAIQRRGDALNKMAGKLGMTVEEIRDALAGA